METQNSPGNVENEKIFIEFCSKRELSKSSIKLYRLSLQRYVNFTGKTLEELIDEADEEEDLRIRLRKRKITKYLSDFKEYVDGLDYSETYKKQMIVFVKAFYNEFDIELPKNKRRKTRSDKKPTSIEDLPTIDEIQSFMEHCNSTYRSIITMGLSSGMSRAEIVSLTFEHLYRAISLDKFPDTLEELIKLLKEKGDFIPLWRVKRIKTGNQYFTFSSPENISCIITYLEELNFKNPDYNLNPKDTLFRNPNSNKPITEESVTSFFNSTNKKYGFRRVNNRVLIRCHNLRKVFATTLEKNKMPHLYTRWLMGHTIDITTDAYFKPDPEAIKEDYIEIVDQLTTNKVQIKVVDKYESVTQELEELRGEVVTIKSKLDSEKITGSLRGKYRIKKED